jgi:glutathione S-transferase
MRARLALYTAKISHEHREVDLKNKPRELLDISPKGTVPVLVLQEGSLLEQSLDIMKWALNKKHIKPEEMELLVANDTVMKQALDRYKYSDRYPGESVYEQRDLWEHFLRKLEELLSPFLTGKDPGLIDMALFPFVRQFSQVDPPWFEKQSYPRLKTWLSHFISSSLYQQIMQKHAPWASNDQPVYISFNSPPSLTESSQE